LKNPVYDRRDCRPATAPEGYEFTGEFRMVGAGEPFLLDYGSVGTGPWRVARHILRRTTAPLVTTTIKTTTTTTYTVLGQEITEAEAKRLLRELEEVV
jgi:hypothetical protein